MEYLRNSSPYIPPEGFYNYIRSIIKFVHKQPLVFELVRKRTVRFYDIKSAVEAGIIFDRKLATPDDDDEEIAFNFALFKYLRLAYRRFTIFEAIYPYRDKDELLDEKFIKNVKVKEEVGRKSAVRNFINEVILPFLNLIMMELSNMKMELETQKSMGISIHIEGNVGDNAFIGDFSQNRGQIGHDWGDQDKID
ncbi:hypothetical protein [Laceyella putida]|uniref:Uncharacterized protein n=1 Tax=Laceyella putida TaxID=110101 RepID=A0ABW2RJ68_9BACL